MSVDHPACPRCGAPHAPGQAYCLECGLSLPDSGVGRVYTRRRRLARGGSSWLPAVLLFLVVAGIGAAVAIAATRSDGEHTIVGTPPPGATVGAFGITTAPPTTAPTTAPAAAPPPQSTPARTTTRPASPARLVAWPGRPGYTIILQSIPTTSAKSGALATARRALSAGMSQVGVLASSNYSSLQPGYYVVFAGIYASQREAEAHLGTARAAGFQFPYVRPVTT